ncbi:Imm42 family immunity protein [Pseudocitrobacter cyperus]|uniref:Imm42 family immunity protein n=1 Tax=Pseudocitrobacter cyperus TaxID=3112843 RepID=A0ABV0HE60_9ENTR
MDNLIIGDKALFAIRLETDKQFASVSIFCDYDEIGNNDEYTLLNTFLALLEDKISNYEYSLADKIVNFDKDAIFSYIVDGYRNSENWKDSQYFSSVWITLDLTPCFDGEVFILLSTDEYDRVIWKKFNSETIRETHLPSGYVLGKIKLLLNRLSS